MRRLVFIMVGALALAGCSRSEETATTTSESGVDRSIEDIRAAEAAMKATSTESQTAADLLGKTKEADASRQAEQ